MGRFALAIALLLVVAGAALGAPRVVDARLHIEGCEAQLDVRQLRRLVQLELRAAAVSPEVQLRCEADGAVELRVGDREERVALERVRRPARTRALALLAVEALRRARTTTAEQSAAPPQEPPPGEPAPATPPVQVAAAAVVDPPAKPHTAIVAATEPARPADGPLRPRRVRLYGGISLGLFLGGVGTFALAGTFAGLSADATRSDAGSMRSAGLSFLGLGSATVIGSAVMLGFYVRERKRR